MADPKKKAQADPDFIPDTSGTPDFIPDSGERPAGVPDEPGAEFREQAQPGSSITSRSILKGAADLFGIGPAKGVGNTVSGVSELIHGIPKIGPKLVPEEGLRAFHAMNEPEGAMQKIGHFGEQAAEFLIPGIGEEAAGAKAASMIPKIGKIAAPAARMAASAVGTGVINKLQGGSFGGGAAAGAGGSVIGEGARAIAPSIAEGAMGITRRAREYGRTPGAAILDETRGIRPESVMKSAGKRIGELTSDMEGRVHAATQAGGLGTTQSAVDLLNRRIGDAPRNARGYGEGLRSLTDLLHFEAPGTGANARRFFDPDELLEMKRGIGREVSTWNPEQRTGVGPVARELYHPIDSEIDRLAPGTKELNSRIGSLIPARDALRRQSLNAGVPQKVFGRIGRPTGALAGSLAGGYEGEKRGGTPGMVMGAGLGLLLPELIASPEGQMALARRMYSRPLRRFSTGSLLQIARPDQE